MNWNAKWICPDVDLGNVCPAFVKEFDLESTPAKAILSITALGVYEVFLNGSRVSNYVLAPGWTSYETRHQYQQYDVASLLQKHNTLQVIVGRGWYRLLTDQMVWGKRQIINRASVPFGLIAQLDWDNGSINTDDSWHVQESCVRFSDIYDGETFDATIENTPFFPVRILDRGLDNLIPQQGEIICEQEHVLPQQIFQTPKGEWVVDFGQEVTGYVQLDLTAKRGDRVTISHAEVLDKDGNFYTDNYRAAKAKLRYICRDGLQTYKPHLTFFGFRYIRVDEFPGTPALDNFQAVVVCSDLRRTGYLRCGDAMVNRLFENVIWGQKSNYLDVPTDCPQRDERLGWTGDAQVFVKTASYTYDVRRFFHKWLADMAADQHANGAIPHVIPAMLDSYGSAAWDDAAVICPWQIYQTYNDREILQQQYECMVRYIDFITNSTKDEFLWTGGTHFEDWLGLDAPAGSYKGSTRADFIASAFYAYSTSLVAKVSAILGYDATPFETLYHNIVKKFRTTFDTYTTQTEHVLALHFGLTENPQKTAADLAQKIRAEGGHLKTGFVGTPYLLHVLSRNGHVDLAYDLFLRREYPSWLFSVKMGATTIWEHWDGINEKGDFWSPDMNSFNHYAYGSVADWVYEEAAGIHPVETAPGFARIRFSPKPDTRLGWLEASIDTVNGPVRSKWVYETGRIRYEIDTPVEADVEIAGKCHTVKPGKYLFFENL